MKKILSILLAFILVLPLMIAKGNLVRADNVSNSASVKSKNYRFEKDWNGSGVFATKTFFFDVSKNWTLENSYINLVFTESQLLENKNSTLTVLINDTPIGSIKLGEKKEYKRTVKIQIPKEKIIEGFNEIKIKTYKRISEKPCIDDVNTGNWIVIHKESYVHIDFKDKEDTTSLKEFPFPYIKESDEIPMNGIIVVPDNVSSSEITTAMMICSNFGAKRKYENINTKVYKFSDAEEKASTNVIYIGQEKNSPKEILSLLSSNELESIKDNAVIKEVQSPYNKEKKMLMVISNDENKLVKAAKLLSSKDLMKQVNRNSIIVDEALNVKDPLNKESENISFLKLGYNNVLLPGSFRQESNFTLNVPKNRFIEKGASIVLKIRYAKNLDFDRSLLTVYINDIPIGSKKLSANNADNDTFQIDIPEDVRNLNNYDIKVAFDLQLKDVFCTFREEDNPWAYVSSESYLHLPYKDGKDFTFQNYPSPFVSNGKFNDVTMILPDEFSSQQLTWAGNIAAYIGHDLELNDGSFKVLTGAEGLKNPPKGNLIVIGTPENNKIIKSFNKNMYIKFNKDFTAFMSNEKINLLPGYASEVATIQFIESPFDKKSKVMLVASVDEKDISLAQRYLKDLNLLRNLKGNSVIIDRMGNLKNLTYGEKENSIGEKFNFGKVITMNSKTKFLIVFLGIVLLFTITAATMYIKKYKKQ
ncbi:cellulose biosynthesis cyclic di-GMP-binding regulatory protein BcsB [Haloimpatiens lingqiaonensis]|uniref:cellulose biosynthesis cyclic di-GMP-binding regulatory protein BcsB n=1 Tax=Haloimpatiens lingqiaonensis TaxID=1380675 RepID=UPI0010FE38E4|nr:cellulose biosynthesis cyclic di-GMP-binding regulatory protein BcsB [Haloimpatiens lingqiaonensis]